MPSVLGRPKRCDYKVVYHAVTGDQFHPVYRIRTVDESGPLGSARQYLTIFELSEDAEVVRPKRGEVDARWVFDAARSTDENGRACLAATIDGVNRLIASGEYRFLDQVLETIPAATASRHIVLALARASFPVRSKLAAWKKFVLNARDAFDAKGLDGSRLMKGIL